MTKPKVYVVYFEGGGAIFVRSGKQFHSDEYFALRNLGSSMDLYFAGARQGPEYTESVMTMVNKDRVNGFVETLAMLGYDPVTVEYADGYLIWPDEE